MKTFATLLFFVIALYWVHTNLLTTSPIKRDTSGLSKPQHKLYDVLRQYSNGDKISLMGACQVDLFVKYTIQVDQKQRVTNLLNDIFKAVYNVSNQLFEVQEINTIYQQVDTLGNKRQIVDATLHAVHNYYTVKVIVDVVDLNGEMYVNYISINPSSNNDVIKRYDVVYQHGGILFNQDNFNHNVRALLDESYRGQNKLVEIDARKQDETNYRLENVLTLSNVLRNYFPANFTKASEQDFDRKGVTGYLEMYFTPKQPTVESPSYCDKLDGQQCIVYQNSTQTEYTQPYMAPGLFFDRSSYPLNKFD